jgi:uncharacterized OB-fold protein
MTSKQVDKARRPILPGIFSQPMARLSDVRLMGSRCNACGETLLGARVACPSCTGRDMESVTLGSRGTLFTYTVCRHRPPGDFRGGEVPYAVGLVTLPEGLRIIAPLVGNPDEIGLHIGMPLELQVEPLYVDDQGLEVVAFKFRPVGTVGAD